MEATDEGGKDMGVLGVVVVIGAIEVGRHDGDIVGAILTVEELAVLQTANLSQGISLVGLLQLRGEQAGLRHGLWCHAGINTAAAQELEFLATVLPRSMDDVHLEDHVLVHEVGQSTLVGDDATDLGCCEEDIFGFLLGKELLDGLLTGEIELFVGTSDNIGIALSLKFADNG